MTNTRSLSLTQYWRYVLWPFVPLPFVSVAFSLVAFCLWPFVQWPFVPWPFVGEPWTTGSHRRALFTTVDNTGDETTVCAVDNRRQSQPEYLPKRASGRGSECGNGISDVNFLIVFHSNCGPVLLNFQDMTVRRTMDGRANDGPTSATVAYRWWASNKIHCLIGLFFLTTECHCRSILVLRLILLLVFIFVFMSISRC